MGEFAKFVKRRNKIAHPSGTVFFNDRTSIDAELELMMKEVTNIQEHMRPVISDVYTEFLKTSSDLETRAYSEPQEEIRVNLIHKNYMSPKDLEVCSTYDLAPLSSHPNFGDINSLHSALVGAFVE